MNAPALPSALRPHQAEIVPKLAQTVRDKAAAAIADLTIAVRWPITTRAELKRAAALVAEAQAAANQLHPEAKDLPRLIEIEQAITGAQPDFNEVAESIMAASMAALEARYGRDAMATLQPAYQRFRDALDAADEAFGVAA
jgi:hypothetical protein